MLDVIGGDRTILGEGGSRDKNVSHPMIFSISANDALDGFL